MKILLAVDGSTYTRHMLAYLAAHEDWLKPGHDFTVLHVLTPLPGGLLAIMTDAEVDARQALEAEAVFKPVRQYLQMHDIQATFEHQVGDPGKLVARRAAEGGFDLVMLGSHGQGALTHLVLGSVVTYVLAHCDVPALILRK